MYTIDIYISKRYISFTVFALYWLTTRANVICCLGAKNRLQPLCTGALLITTGVEIVEIDVIVMQINMLAQSAGVKCFGLKLKTPAKTTTYTNYI